MVGITQTSMIDLKLLLIRQKENGDLVGECVVHSSTEANKRAPAFKLTESERLYSVLVNDLTPLTRK